MSGAGNPRATIEDAESAEEETSPDHERRADEDKAPDDKPDREPRKTRVKLASPRAERTTADAAASDDRRRRLGRTTAAHDDTTTADDERPAD